MKPSAKYPTSEHVFLVDFFSKTYKIQFPYTKSFSNNVIGKSRHNEAH